jgi:hypothetical protein
MQIVEEPGKPVLFNGKYLVVTGEGTMGFMTPEQYATGDYSKAVPPTDQERAEVAAQFSNE